MDDTNTNAYNVIIGEGMLGKVGKHCSLEKKGNKQIKSLQRMSFQGHGGAIGFAIFDRRLAVFCDKPGEYLAKYRVQDFHPGLFV
jgi:hypothetical protein